MTGIIEQSVDVEKRLMTFYGNSEDTKPTAGIADGSVCIETDTHDIYMFDEANEIWRQI